MPNHNHCVKVKICGLRSLQDLQAAYGADAVGFLAEAPTSPRSLPLEIIKILVPQVPLFTASVLVVPFKDPLRIGWLASEIEPHAVQIHTEVSAIDAKRIRQAVPAKVRLYGLVGIAGGAEPSVKRAVALAQSGLDGLILDTQTNTQSGGTGEVHDWTLSRQIRDAVTPFPVLLAGGLNAQNVLEAIHAVGPYAVDVSSGVEEGDAKSPAKIAEFIRRARSYGSQNS
jgi:phosphoribosylanthranilate isomerase